MARAPFSIGRRSVSAKNSSKQVWYARFFDGDGNVIQYVTLRSAKSRIHATRLAEEILKQGVISNSANPEAIAYCLEFWTPDSEYIQSRSLRGHKPSFLYVRENRKLIVRLWAPILGTRRIADLRREVLERGILKMHGDGIPPRQINKALQALMVVYRYFTALKDLPDRLRNVKKVAENTNERGVLSMEEAARLIALTEVDPRARCAVLLSMLAGLRLGETRGLQREDVDREKGILHIRGNFVDAREGRKAPKWGSSRDVPLPAVLLEAIDLCEELSDSPFILWNDSGRKDRPCEYKLIETGFRAMLRRIGIAEEERKRRRLVFHSGRHFYVSALRAAGVADVMARSLAGHSSTVMSDHYTHAAIIDFAEARVSLDRIVLKYDRYPSNQPHPFMVAKA